MTHSISAVSPIAVGFDVGDKRTHWCALDGDRKVHSRGSFRTTHNELEQALVPFRGVSSKDCTAG